MTPRCFSALEGTEPLVTEETVPDETGPLTGGDIFSNVKAGMVYPLVVELKHSWNSPGILLANGLACQPFHPV